MSKVVTVEELRAHFDEHLAEVKRGETLTLVDGKSSIATLAPPDDVIRYAHVPAPGSRLSDFKPSPRPKGLVTDALDLVNEDRDSEWAKNGL
jgi:antitoxin (DNA-binding transcriptional repressor) of toxin-antitoxin stability system